MYRYVLAPLCAAAVLFTSSSSALAAYFPHYYVEAAPGTARGIYHHSTGEFWFSIGQGVNLIGIEAPGLINVEQSPKTPRAPNDPIVPQQYDKNVLACFDVSNPLPTGVFYQGKILPPFLLPSNGTIPTIGFGYQLNQADFVVVPIDVIWIPEPGTASLLGLGLAAVTLKRRR